MSLTVHDGGTAYFECQVTGDPKPNIAWFHESTKIKLTEDFEQSYDDDCLCTLWIKEVYPEDAGKYTVAAKNPHGTATCAAELMVHEGSD